MCFQSTYLCKNARSARYHNPALTVSTLASQYIPVLGDIQVGHGQGHTTIHSPARAFLAQVEEAAQLLVIRGSQTMSMDYQVLCQVLRSKHQE